MIKLSNFCFFLSAYLSYLSLIFSDFVFVTFLEKPNLKTDGMRFLCMTFVFFLFVDGDAVLPELSGSDCVSVESLRLGFGLLEAVLVPSTQILPGKLGPHHYNIIFIPKQSLDVVGLKELDILHTQIFDNHLGFGNNEIIVWDVVQLKTCRDVDVGDFGIGFIILA